VVTKSGGNGFRGDVNLYYADEKLGSTLRSEEEISETGASPPPLDRYLGDRLEPPCGQKNKLY
jgi:hypothetical protein